MGFFKKIWGKIKEFFSKLIQKCKTNIPFAISLSLFVVSLCVFLGILINDAVQAHKMGNANSDFWDTIHQAELSKTPAPTGMTSTPAPTNTPADTSTPTPTEALPTDTPVATNTPTPTNTSTPTPSPVMSAGGAAAYEKNHDYIGWLEILGNYNGGLSEKNRVNHPVFQTFDDPNTPYDPNDSDTNEGWYYLYRDANGNKNKYGSLFVDERCRVGTGTAADNYENGIKPTSNIIIYGHNVVNYLMFGALKQYWDSSFYKAHKTFSLTTCYEYREYEIIAYFDDTIPEDFTYHFASFINAYTQEDFDKWYQFIKSKSARDTKVTAEFGDEFVTLVTCASGTSAPTRKVVVGKRIK